MKSLLLTNQTFCYVFVGRHSSVSLSPAHFGSHLAVFKLLDSWYLCCWIKRRKYSIILLSSTRRDEVLQVEYDVCLESQLRFLISKIKVV